MALYTYHFLNPQEIRILALHPGSGSGPLKGSLITRSLKNYIAAAENILIDDGESFEALSYCWETSSRGCQFVTTEGNILITASLKSALYHLRRVDKTRLLWADGICINQNDLEERANQVRIMGDIYRAARRTVVFLGDEKDDSTAGFERLCAWWKFNVAPYGLNGRSVEETENRISMKLPSLPENAQPPPPSTDDFWVPARKIWLRPWFTRVWIVQEFILARDVTIVCGDVEMPWQHLYLATMNSNAASDGDTWLGQPDVYDAVVSFSTLGTLRIMHRGAQYKNNLSLGDLINLLPGRFASITQDYFFGILGMASDADRAEYCPDYKSPARDVMIRFARCLISQPIGPELFARAGLGEPRGDVPSWAAGLSGPLPSVWPLAYKQLAGVPDYKTSGPSSFAPSFEPADDEVLILQGFPIDTIDQVFQLTSRANFLRDAYQAFQASRLNIGSTPVDTAIARTLLADKFISSDYSSTAEMPQERVLHMGLLYWLARKQGKSDADATALVTSQFEGTTSQAVQEARLSFGNSYNCVRDRHDLMPCVSVSGRPGMVSKYCRKGDEVWILAGCPCPMVLRPSGTRQGCFKVLANAYVFGAMYGELCDDGMEFITVRVD